MLNPSTHGYSSCCALALAPLRRLRPVLAPRPVTPPALRAAASNLVADRAASRLARAGPPRWAVARRLLGGALRSRAPAACMLCPQPWRLRRRRRGQAALRSMSPAGVGPDRPRPVAGCSGGTAVGPRPSRMRRSTTCARRNLSGRGPAKLSRRGPRPCVCGARGASLACALGGDGRVARSQRCCGRLGGAPSPAAARRRAPTSGMLASQGTGRDRLFLRIIEHLTIDRAADLGLASVAECSMRVPDSCIGNGRGGRVVCARKEHLGGGTT